MEAFDPKIRHASQVMSRNYGIDLLYLQLRIYASPVVLLNSRLRLWVLGEEESKALT